MRFLAIHAGYFRSELTEKGRSPVVEEAADPVVEASEALLIMLSVEKPDEASPDETLRKTCEEITKIAANLKVENLVLHSFAHLFGDLSSPQFAAGFITRLEDSLREAGFNVRHTPFGWFNTMELKAKGHPFSRISRRIIAEDKHS